MTLATLGEFADLFRGNTDAYGQFIPGNPAAEGEKQKGSCITTTAPLEVGQYRQHLQGAVGLGVCPVTKEGQCAFTVIDVDVYNETMTRTLLDKIAEIGTPLCPFRSKSGGLHLYVFYEDFVDARTARDNANFIRRLLGLPQNTEIFPKQTVLTAGQKGSWINLPYFGGDNSARALIRGDGSLEPDVTNAVDFCLKRRISLKQFTAWQNNLPLNDAPPCLQTLYFEPTVTERNNYLFSLACYYKAKYGDDFEQYVQDANSKLLNPLSEDELQHTVLASQRKNNYGYRCHDSPLCAYCDKHECATRKYTIGDTVSELNYEQLIQYLADPPYYDWIINGVPLRFNSEQEIIQQDKFIELCMRKLSIVPNKLKREVWTAIINKALKNKEVKEMQFDTSSEFDIAKDVINRFLLSCKLGYTMNDTLGSGKPYLSNREQSIIVMLQDVLKQVQNTLKSSIGARDVAQYLTSLSGVQSVRKVYGISTRVWSIPIASLFANQEERKEWLASLMDDASGTLDENGERKSATQIVDEVLDEQVEEDI